jgi:hypothetical protein
VAAVAFQDPFLLRLPAANRDGSTSPASSSCGRRYVSGSFFCRRRPLNIPNSGDRDHCLDGGLLKANLKEEPSFLFSLFFWSNLHLPYLPFWIIISDGDKLRGCSE